MAIKKVSPPPQSRGRTSTLDPKVLEDWAKALESGPGEWHSDDSQSYENVKQARYQASRIKRLLVSNRDFNGDQLRARTWTEDGKFLFALRFTPE